MEATRFHRSGVREIESMQDSPAPKTRQNLGHMIWERFRAIGGVDLPVIAREAIREPDIATDEISAGE